MYSILPHRLKVVFVAMVLFILPAIKSGAQSQGPYNPAGVSEQDIICLICAGSSWLALNNVETANDTFATVSLLPYPTFTPPEYYYSRILYTSKFRFSIPPAATITGLQVVIKRKASALNAVVDTIVTLLINQVDTGANNASPITWGTINTPVTYGGPGNLWGLPLTPAMVNDSVFGVGLKVRNLSDSSRVASVDNIQMTVYYSVPITPPVAAFTADKTVICAGDTVSFRDQSAGSPTSWHWTFEGGSPASSNSQNPQVVYATAGTDSVKLVVSNTFGSDSLTKAAYILVNPLPVPGTAGGVAICNGDTDELSATGGTAFQWSPCMALSSCSVYNPSAWPSSTTIYYVKVTDVNGCSASDSVTVMVNALPAQPVITVSGYMLTSSPASGYQWYLNDTAVNGATSQAYTATQSGSYTVVITNAQGCKSVSLPQQITVTAIKNIAGYSENSVVYPNPFTGGNLRYSVPNSFIGAQAILYDVTGKELWRQTINEANGMFTNAHMLNGIYFLKINNEMLKLVCE